MTKSESIKELATALSMAQGQIHGAAKDTENPFFKSKYADLASVWDACRDALSSNGLSVVQAARAIEGGVEVETLLLHASGEWISETLAIPVAKADAQGFGSALTYCRRYGLSAMVGIAPEDDDGNAAAKAKPDAGAFKPARKVAEDVRQSLPIEMQKKVDYLGGRILDAFAANDVRLAYTAYLDAKGVLDADAQVGLWALISPAQRRIIKEMGEAEKIASLRAMEERN